MATTGRLKKHIHYGDIPEMEFDVIQEYENEYDELLLKLGSRISRLCMGGVHSSHRRKGLMDKVNKVIGEIGHLLSKWLRRDKSHNGLVRSMVADNFYRLARLFAVLEQHYSLARLAASRIARDVYINDPVVLDCRIYAQEVLKAVEWKHKDDLNFRDAVKGQLKILKKEQVDGPGSYVEPEKVLKRTTIKEMSLFRTREERKKSIYVSERDKKTKRSGDPSSNGDFTGGSGIETEGAALFRDQHNAEKEKRRRERERLEAAAREAQEELDREKAAAEARYEMQLKAEQQEMDILNRASQAQKERSSRPSAAAAAGRKTAEDAPKGRNFEVTGEGYFLTGPSEQKKRKTDISPTAHKGFDPGRLIQGAEKLQGREGRLQQLHNEHLYGAQIPLSPMGFQMQQQGGNLGLVHRMSQLPPRVSCQAMARLSQREAGAQRGAGAATGAVEFEPTVRPSAMGVRPSQAPRPSAVAAIPPITMMAENGAMGCTTSDGVGIGISAKAQEVAIVDADGDTVHDPEQRVDCLQQALEETNQHAAAVEEQAAAAAGAQGGPASANASAAGNVASAAGDASGTSSGPVPSPIDGALASASASAGAYNTSSGGRAAYNNSSAGKAAYTTNSPAPGSPNATPAPTGGEWTKNGYDPGADFKNEKTVQKPVAGRLDPSRKPGETGELLTPQDWKNQNKKNLGGGGNVVSAGDAPANIAAGAFYKDANGKWVRKQAPKPQKADFRAFVPGADNAEPEESTPAAAEETPAAPAEEAAAPPAEEAAAPPAEEAAEAS
ncbi:unnamed protein product [Amoebophrya sp. A120]|nr:unnamed protein product [Amoebophrya sp. A120]|eukprot:GSA120T00003234001.1